ncbi:hypothetical protein Tco_1289710 [Tanacetum coccineum]
MVELDEDEESYAIAFVDSGFNDDVDDIGSKTELESHKEHLEHVSGDDKEIEKENDDEKVKKEKEVVQIEKEKNDDANVEKTDDIVKEKEVADVSDKRILEELTAIVSPTTATTSKTSFTSKRKKRSFPSKTRTLLGSIHSHIKDKFITQEFFTEKIREVPKHCNTVVPELRDAKTNEMI